MEGQSAIDLPLTLHPGGTMKVPNWGVYVMLAGSVIGVVLLYCELKRRGFPDPF
jgi:hypothetical protein